MNYKRVYERIKKITDDYDDGTHLMDADSCMCTISDIIDAEEEAERIEHAKIKCFGKGLWAACLSCTVGSACQEEYKKIQKEKQNGKGCSAEDDKSQETEV